MPQPPVNRQSGARVLYRRNPSSVTRLTFPDGHEGWLVIGDVDGTVVLLDAVPARYPRRRNDVRDR
jgi:hypothetical protein